MSQATSAGAPAFRVVIDGASDTARAHRDPGLDRVLHVFDAAWHGIRSATSCLPGHKAAISHRVPVDLAAREVLAALVADAGIESVCYQGFSESALDLAGWFAREFGPRLRQYVVTHVSPAQFENEFELRMLRAMQDGLRSGLFRRLGSVKARFHSVVPEFWPEVLVNMAPNIALPVALRDTSAVLIPVENTWRKNLYSNVLAAVRAEGTGPVYVVNWPTGLERIVDLSRVQKIPFMRPARMLATAAACGAVMHASLIECQPMTLLEGLAVGTPCISARLGIHADIDAHPLAELCEVEFPDDVGALQRALERVRALWRTDPGALGAMIADNLALRRRLCIESYTRFLE